MKPLRILPNLDGIINHEDAALEGNVACPCGHHAFYLEHTGKQTKGIFSAHLVLKNSQLKVIAICSTCGNKITLYDSTLDGLKPKPVLDNIYQYEKFLLKGKQEYFQIHMMYNYIEGNLKDENGAYSNAFSECFIEIHNEKNKKMRLIEEV